MQPKSRASLKSTQSTNRQGFGVDAVVDENREDIAKLLDALEAEYDFRIVYACESGSRAWGFASHNSDFDIRFIFVRPVEAYLKLRAAVDAFDVPDQGDFDAGGWDIRKTAELMWRSNPPLLEWLDSRIVYRADGVISKRLIELRDIYFDPKKATFHYLSLAHNVTKSYLGDPQPKRKKYLYALRPLSAIRYIELHMAQPPTLMTDTLDAIDWPEPVMNAMNALLEEKRRGDELGRAPRDAVLDQHIEAGLQHAEQLAHSLPVNKESQEQLNELIKDAILQNSKTIE